MSRLIDLKKKFGDSSDAGKALADLSEFVSIVSLGTAVSGGTLTIPLILSHSSKALAGLSKLLQILLPAKDAESDTFDPAERADDLFYVFAQRAYLKALKPLKKKLPQSACVAPNMLPALRTQLEEIVLRPDRAEAKFEFGWSPDSGPLALFECYRHYMGVILLGMGVQKDQVTHWLGEVEKRARSYLFLDLTEVGQNREWMVHYQLLSNNARILDILQGFTSPASEIGSVPWQKYLNDLENKPALPIWGEEEHGLGIDKLFVEPGYIYARSTNAESTALRSYAPLLTFLTGLISHRRPSSELIFVMGGPGLGKTSLMEVFCAALANSRTVPVVLVPAKRLDPRRPLLGEVQNFLTGIGHGAVADILGNIDECVIAIDGFDELAHATLSTLDHFFRGAQELVRERSGSRMRIILSGRQTLFSENDVSIPRGSHIINLISFDLPRVTAWSDNWRNSTGGTFDGSVYLRSRSSDLRELASQPMLLYLLAKMHEEGRSIPTDFGSTRGVRYRLYSQMLDWVCQRQEGKGVATPLTARLRRFLQIAGLATHQSGQRALHWKQFARVLRQHGLAESSGELESRMYSTVLAFAFSNVDDRAWEFTHKSFGEALAAEAIGRILTDIGEPGSDGEPWRMTLLQATQLWVETFGPHHLTHDILDFWDGWLESKGDTFVIHLLPRLIEILHQLLGRSCAEALSSTSFQAERPPHLVLGNAVRSWFAIANACLGEAIAASGADCFDQHGWELEPDLYRSGVYLSQLVARVSPGEAGGLFQWTSKLVKVIRKEHSSRYVERLLQILISFHPETRNSTWQKGKTAHPSVLDLARKE